MLSDMSASDSENISAALAVKRALMDTFRKLYKSRNMCLIDDTPALTPAPEKFFALRVVNFKYGGHGGI